MANELCEPGGPDDFKTTPLATRFDGTWPEQLICFEPGGRQCPPPATTSFRARVAGTGQEQHAQTADLETSHEAVLQIAAMRCFSNIDCGDTETGAVLHYGKLWLALRADRQAVTALEYGLIAGVIVATVLFGFTLLAGDLSQQFQSIGNSVTDG